MRVNSGTGSSKSSSSPTVWGRKRGGHDWEIKQYTTSPWNALHGTTIPRQWIQSARQVRMLLLKNRKATEPELASPWQELGRWGEFTTETIILHRLLGFPRRDGERDFLVHFVSSWRSPKDPLSKLSDSLFYLKKKKNLVALFLKWIAWLGRKRVKSPGKLQLSFSSEGLFRHLTCPRQVGG